MALDLPRFTESDVAETDGEPGEEGGETGECDEPVEDHGSVACQVDVGECTKDEPGDDGEGRAGGFVDGGEYFGGVAVLGEGGEGTGAGVHAGETDGEHGYADGGVDQVARGNGFLSPLSSVRMILSSREANSVGSRSRNSISPVLAMPRCAQEISNLDNPLELSRTLWSGLAPFSSIEVSYSLEIARFRRQNQGL